MERRLDDLEEETERIRLILTGDLSTVGLIESMRSLTSLVGEMKARQEAIARDIDVLKRLEQTRDDMRKGEAEATRRLRRFLYVVGTLMLGASGSILGYVGKLLVTVGLPP